jgi:hypothetical protein
MMSNNVIAWFVVLGLLALIVISEVILNLARHREVQRLVGTVCQVAETDCEDGDARTKRVAEAAQLARDINST